MENGYDLNNKRQNGQNGWSEWSKYVLKELERQAEEDKNIRTDMENVLGNIKTEQTLQGKQIARLEVKAGMWGIIGGIATILVYIAIEMIKKGQV